MSKVILFIDGENFLHKVEDVLKEAGIDKNDILPAPTDIGAVRLSSVAASSPRWPSGSIRRQENKLPSSQTRRYSRSLNKLDLASIDLNKLFRVPLKGFKLSRKIFYAARLHFCPDTRKKSKELIKFQRKLRNQLIKQGYKFIIAGNVRAQKVNKRVVFREKGVDVKIAVDLISLACDKKLDTAILCSSDSDLQPAIKELKGRNVEVVYLGFETSPNKGLTYTTDRTILLRNPEVMAALPKTAK